MFQFTGLLFYNYGFIIEYLRITIGEFPHSDISGSKHTYCSPKHFAVCRVLLQLLVPRHSPCALSNLITIFQLFPNLMRYFNVIHSTDFLNFHLGLFYVSLPHYLVFKELFFFERNNLSKLSKISQYA